VADPPEARTEMGWEVKPHALDDLLVAVHQRYRPGPLVITENGASYDTGPDEHGVIDDQKRLAYFQGHLAACHRAIAQDVPLTGYFAWSLMDNFEWAHGYRQRFGLVYVDYETLARTPKASARWYAEVMARGGLDD